MNLILVGAVAAAVIVPFVLIAGSFRVVVPANAVPIVQSAKRATLYGRDMGGQAIGAALEGLRNTEAGAAVLHAVTGGASK